MHFFTASLTDQGQFVAPVIHLILPCADLPKIAQCPTKTRRRRRIGSCSTATTTPPLLLSLKYETWSITAKSSPPGLLVSLRRRCSTLPAHFGHFRPKPDLTLWPDASGSFQRRNHSLHQSTLFIPSTGLVLSKLLHEDSRITTFLFCELLLNDPRSSDQDAHIGPTLKTRSLLSPQPAPSGMFWFFPPPSLSAKEYFNISQAWRFFWWPTVLFCWYLDYFCCVLHPQEPKRSCRTKRRRRAPVRALLTSISCLTSKRKQRNCAFLRLMWSVLCRTQNKTKIAIKSIHCHKKRSFNQCNSLELFLKRFFWRFNWTVGFSELTRMEVA